jgi:group I intron endonuclease
MIGIYLITIGNRFYIGQSDDLDRRNKHHQWSLHSGKHCNKYMLICFRKYKDYGFSILEVCTMDKLDEREQYYIDMYFELYPKQMMNSSCFVESRRGVPMSEETKRKIGESAKTRGKLSEEHRKKLALAKLGKPRSEETKKKLSEFNKSKIIPNWHRQRISEAQKGRIRTEAERRCVRESRAKSYLFVDPNGNVVQICNLKQFCLDNGLDRTCMHNVYVGKHKQHKDWRCYHSPS